MRRPARDARLGVKGRGIRPRTQAMCEYREMSELHDFLQRRARLFVLSGAGVSTDSGIPDYRDEGASGAGARP